MSMEETKEEEQDPSTMMTDCTVDEAKYLLEHIVHMVISKVGVWLVVENFNAVLVRDNHAYPMGLGKYY